MTRFLLSSALGLVIAGGAMAQDPNASPNYGSTNLRAGFVPDPHSISITAGGSITPNSKMGASCRGEISDAPDYVVDYRSGSSDLYIRARSNDDITLVVHGPDGRWSCNDDSDGLNPEVVFDNPRSGEYAIWVGTYGGGYSEATLAVSELSSSGYGDNSTGGDVVDLFGNPTYGTISLNSGFSPDPHTTSLTAGGTIDANQVESSCRGKIARNPDLRLDYDAGSLPLYIRSRSSSDTTLVVNDPNGTWHCDDDSAGSLDPQIHLSSPSSGTYDIWVGTYGDDTASATLEISELSSSNSSSTPTGWTPDFTEGPAFGTTRLRAGFTPDPREVRVTAGGTHSASGVGSNCRGNIANAPDVRLQWDGGDITIKAEARDDITLIVNDPNGNWHCDDDSGNGLNPLLRLNGSGQYDIWVGTYGGGSGIPATVVFTELD
ncbi:hypothetical protein [Woodsholea maritima]|uniref:hypothetical protein n=1 Tax=Woodsholea maritima TaxID=240237 RepID=UPI00036A8657|nr:hypothetical protein [Woodsholea maritima]